MPIGPSASSPTLNCMSKCLMIGAPETSTRACPAMLPGGSLGLHMHSYVIKYLMSHARNIQRATKRSYGR